MPVVTNATAVDRTIRALRKAGRLEPEHEALEVMVRRMAKAVDADPENDKLWREYRQGVAMLMAATEGGDAGDEFGAFLLAVRTPVVNAKKSR